MPSCRMQIVIFLLLGFSAAIPGYELLADEPVLFRERDLHISLERKETVNEAAVTLKIRRPELGKIDVLGVFDIPNPSRIVIDLKDVKIGKGRTIRVPNNPWLKLLRTGQHANKLRLVLDLKTQQVPAYTWNQTGDLLSLKIGKTAKRSLTPEPSSSPVLSSPTPAPSVEATSTPEPTTEPAVVESAPPNAERPTLVPQEFVESHPTPEPTATHTASSTAAPTPSLEESVEPPVTASVEPSPSPTATEDLEDVIPSPPPEPSATPTPAAAPEKTPTPTAANELLGIEFAYEAGGKPVLKIRLTKRMKFSLIRKDDKVYHLILPGCGLGAPSQSLPQFPPQDFKPFSLVQPKAAGNQLTIIIGVERNSRVTAIISDNEIWVRPIGG